MCVCVCVCVCVDKGCVDRVCVVKGGGCEEKGVVKGCDKGGVHPRTQPKRVVRILLESILVTCRVIM